MNDSDLNNLVYGTRMVSKLCLTALRFTLFFLRPSLISICFVFIVQSWTTKSSEVLPDVAEVNLEHHVGAS